MSVTIFCFVFVSILFWRLGLDTELILLEFTSSVAYYGLNIIFIYNSHKINQTVSGFICQYERFLYGRALLHILRPTLTIVNQLNL